MIRLGLTSAYDILPYDGLLWTYAFWLNFVFHDFFNKSFVSYVIHMRLSMAIFLLITFVVRRLFNMLLI